ncbi:MAG: GNAT family N-acyltransferase [Pseudomonadota bacterium]
MTVLLDKGGLRARIATSPQDLAAAQQLRGLCFHGCGNDRDALDARCTHVLIESRDGTLVSCFRMLHLMGRDISKSYSARYYDLTSLELYDGAMVELGRFCIRPGHAQDPDVLRVAWGALTAYVDRENVALLFGCSSFAGTDAARYLDSFAVLKERHLAPARWLPRIKAPNVFRFAGRLRRKPDMARALRNMPPLLRTYLMMGGWVSDHAVVDAEMNTLHVFTGVEISAIPAARKRLLRAVAS